MNGTRYNAQVRARHLAELTSGEPFDVLVVGGGVTGTGAALDAASRGLRVGILEAQDWASGTSQWSSKLVHGGLRYLYQLDVALVAEALRERGLLLTTIAPHLVEAQAFLWPLRTPVVERCYSAAGVGVYDLLARLGSRGAATVPLQRHHTRKGALALFPSLREDALIGAIRFYDAKVDDARLVLALARTAIGLGARAATRTEVTGFLRDDTGQVVGATATDLETGRELAVRARHVIAATGVWTDEVQTLAGAGRPLRVLASKGVHIVVRKERIEGSTGMFLRTEKSVLFVIPWDRFWVIGTTDTPWTQELRHPVATAADIDYLLDHTNEVLSPPLTRQDIVGVYAGLRPLLRPDDAPGRPSATTAVSREHTVAEVAPGLCAVAGGKLTTYRVMARDAVDFALRNELGTPRSVTERLPLVGAASYVALSRRAPVIAAERGWPQERVHHLLRRYGDEVPTILAMVDADPGLGEPLAAAPAYLRAEVAFAVTHEGALHLEDVLLHRVRLDYETRDRGLSAADEIAAVMAPLLGWDAQALAAERMQYDRSVAAQADAESRLTDADASGARLTAPDIRPVRRGAGG